MRRRHAWTLLGILAPVIVLSAAFAADQEPPKITELKVVTKPGQVYGRAVATIGNKAVIISSDALQAWPIMDGQGALMLLAARKPGQQNRLRYYELESGKGRKLGLVPFSHATMSESSLPNTSWAFAVGGINPATGRSVTFCGDTQTVHAELEDASQPQFEGDSLSFQRSNRQETIRTSWLLGQEAYGQIYIAPGTAPTQYLQFLAAGTFIESDDNGTVELGRWITDGRTFRVTTPRKPEAHWNMSELKTITGVPAGSRLDVRLLAPLSSRTTKKGQQIEAVLISPAISDGVILIPQGSEFVGQVVYAHGVGLGVEHETAALRVHFSSVKFPDGRTLPVDARVFQVENSRENVTKDGTIKGIRSTGTIGYTAENQISSLTQIDPVAYLFTSSSGPAVLGFAEPEILYNAGTEIDIEFNEPVITARPYPPRTHALDLTVNQTQQFGAIVKALPFRTKTEDRNKPSDITNLIFVGTPQSLQRAFDAAGWTSADELTAAATFQTVKTLTGNQTYTQAPMSMLLLGDDKPIFTLQKTTNTFSSRHHLRVFDTKETFDGEPVLTASSTQDIGIAFSSKQKTFIHVIDQYLDNERSKIVNDLVFTGCVDGLELYPRPWVPRDDYNSTGDRMITDGAAAVLRLNNCDHPNATSTSVAQRAPWYERSERNTVLSVRDTLYRGNLVYSGISNGFKVHNYLATRNELGDSAGSWRKSDASGTQYRLAGASTPSLLRRAPWQQKSSKEEDAEVDEMSRALIKAHKWDPPHYEIALNLGYSNYRNSVLEVTLVDYLSSKNEQEYFLGLGDYVGDGWAAGVSLTLNSWNWISNEFSYTRQQTKFGLFALQVSTDPTSEPSLDVQTVGLITRRVAYNTVFNMRPRKSRWRPYITAGPAFQLLSLSDSPLKKPSGYFRLGLSNVGMIKAAFDFGSVAPLDGGGIFQFGLQYGAGIKFRVTPRFTTRLDYGETWSPNPKIIRDSYLGYDPVGLDSSYQTQVQNFQQPGKYIQQRATAGFAYTF